MKKLYLLFTLLLSMLGATTAFAQDEVTIPVDMNNGRWVQWNGNSTFPFARTWNSTTTPAISVCCTTGGNSTTDIRGNSFNGANNMSAYGDAMVNLMFFSNLSTYQIMVEEGWYITSVDFDFDVTAWTSSNGFYNFPEESGLSVTAEDLEAVVSANPDDIQHISWENEDDEVYTFTFNVNRVADDNGFARTSNFVVKVKKQGEAKAALQALQQVLTTYQDYKFLTGSEPGNYDEAKVEAFQDAIDAALEADGNPDLDGLPDAELATMYREMAQAIKDAYEAVLASRNTVYNIADGYYRLKTGLVYSANVVIGQDGETGEDITETQNVDKYMLSALEGENIYGRWGSVENLDADCSSLWKITNKEDGIDFQNMATDARFTTVATSSSAKMTLTSESLMAIEPVGTVDDVTYTNIRVSTQEANKYFYLHQGGHGGGTGSGSYLVGWSTSAGFNGDGEWAAGGSEWVFVPVDATAAEEIIKAYEPTKDQLLMKERYKLMVADAPGKVEIAHDRTTVISGDSLIADSTQFSSPNSDRDEGKSFAALLDGNPATIWHGDWHNDYKGDVQYIQVEITDEDVTAAALKFTRRNTTANQVTQFTVYGTNEPIGPEDSLKVANGCEKLAVLNTPYSAAGEVITSAGFFTKGYKYLRFAFTGNTANAKFAHFAEFQLYKATISESETSQFNVLGDIAKNMEDVLNAQDGLNVDDLTAEQYNAMKSAYDAFIAKFVDPTELRETLAEVQGIGEGIVTGTQPGFWKDETTGASLSNLLTTAKAYDEAGAYTQEKSDEYVANLKTLAEDVYAAANQIQEGKWYRIRFATEEDFDAHEWNKSAGYVAPAEDKPEIDAPLFGKYVTVANWVEIDLDETTKGYDLEMFEEEQSTFIGKNLYFMDDDAITKKDMSMFRFIAVGDSAYLLQNKATGLFLKAAGASGAVRLGVQPSLFNTRAVGYGLNIIASKNLIGGTNENYLHGQKSNNILVTWNATAPGSASAMYIEEAGEVAADYTNTADIAIQMGKLQAFCYPFEISKIDDEYGQAWSVNAIEDNKISLCKIADKIDAGRPFIYLRGETKDFIEDEEAEPVPFTFNTSAIAIEPQAEAALKGTYSTIKIDRGDVYCKGNELVVNTVGKDDIMVTYTYVDANSAYISGETPLDPNAELEVVWDKDAADGIMTALQNVSKSGVIYTVDGRIAGKGNLNNVKNLGRGIYILNGTKVIVK